MALTSSWRKGQRQWKATLTTAKCLFVDLSSSLGCLLASLTCGLNKCHRHNSFSGPTNFSEVSGSVLSESMNPGWPPETRLPSKNLKKCLLWSCIYGVVACMCASFVLLDFNSLSALPGQLNCLGLHIPNAHMGCSRFPWRLRLHASPWRFSAYFHLHRNVPKF